MSTAEPTATQAEIDRAHLEVQLQERNFVPPDERSENEDATITWLGWIQDERRVVNICFEGDGHYGFTLWRDDKFKAGEEDGDICKPIPTDLDAYLRELAAIRFSRINEELGID